MLRYLLPLLLLAGQGAAQDAAERAVAEAALTALQPLSFSKHREYCGFIGYNDDGALEASRATPGTLAGCSADWPTDLAVVASYHTHGAFDRDYFNEVPSVIDVEGDHQFLLNGWVSTPGGRLWYIDGRARTIHLQCGPGCLPIAPGFYKGANGVIRERYTLDELRQFLGD